MRSGGLYGGSVPIDAPDDGASYVRRSRRWLKLPATDTTDPVVVPVSQIESAVADYLRSNPPAAGQNASDAMVQQVVDVFMAAHPVEDGEDGKDATTEMVADAVSAWLADNRPKDGTDGEDASDAQVAAAVAAYLAANPIHQGADATPEMVATAVKAWLTANPPANGRDGYDATPAMVASAVEGWFAAHPVKDGANATDAQVATAVAAYLAAHPIKDGTNGLNATDAQVLAAVTAYIASHPIKDGANATDAQVATAVAAYFTANPPAPFLRQITLTETAAVIISAGTRHMNVACPGVVKGKSYVLVPVPTTTSPNGIDDGYIYYGAVAIADNMLRLKYLTPVLAIGAGYSFVFNVFRLNSP